MRKVSTVRTLVAVFLLASLTAIAFAAVPSAGAEAPGPCAYTGHAFLNDDPVPAGTGVRVLEGVTVLGETTTGTGVPDDNEFYMDGIIAEPGTVVNFQIWCDYMGEWVPADETATHEMYGVVEVDLHAGAPTLHIDVAPFLFVYPWPDCALPDALTNIGPDGEDVVVVVWGTAEVESEWQWVSYDPDTGGGHLGPLGLEQGKPYVMQVTGAGVCNEWEMYIPE